MAALLAEVSLPAIVGDHMVLQQKPPDWIWGWDNPGTKVTVSGSSRRQIEDVLTGEVWMRRPGNSTCDSSWRKIGLETWKRLPPIFPACGSYSHHSPVRRNCRTTIS